MCFGIFSRRFFNCSNNQVAPKMIEPCSITTRITTITTIKALLFFIVLPSSIYFDWNLVPPVLKAL